MAAAESLPVPEIAVQTFTTFDAVIIQTGYVSRIFDVIQGQTWIDWMGDESPIVIYGKDILWGEREGEGEYNPDILPLHKHIKEEAINIIKKKELDGVLVFVGPEVKGEIEIGFSMEIINTLENLDYCAYCRTGSINQMTIYTTDKVKILHIELDTSSG